MGNRLTLEKGRPKSCNGMVKVEIVGKRGGGAGKIKKQDYASTAQRRMGPPLSQGGGARKNGTKHDKQEEGRGIGKGKAASLSLQDNTLMPRMEWEGDGKKPSRD